MRVDHIRIRELEAYLESDLFKKAKVIPISRRRARAHVMNPRARLEDVALILIYLDDQLAGYLGLIPDLLHIPSQIPQPVAWMSCIWVSPNARGRGVAKRMLKDAFEVWDDKLLATEFTAAAKSLYDKMGLFDELSSLKGCRAYLRLNMAVLLLKKNPAYRRIRPFLQLADWSFNLVHDLRLAFCQRKLIPELQAQHISKIDEATWVFIQSLQKGELLQRSQADFNWLLQYPWLANDEEANADRQRYYFSVFAKRFEFLAFKLFRKTQLVAFVILAIRDDALKVPYLYCLPAEEKAVSTFIIHFMLKERLSILTTYSPILYRHLTHSAKPFFLIRDFQRDYLVSKSLSANCRKQPVLIKDGDGDCAFT